MKVTILGSGTSTGVPALLCDCPTCRSTDPRDKRQRCSALVTTSAGKNLLIDCGPDFRAQMLSAGNPPIDAVLTTHHHYDHVGGMDDLRPYCYHRPADRGDMPIYGPQAVMDDLHRRMPYSFGPDLYPGVPTFSLHPLQAGRNFTVEGQEIMPLQIIHGKMPILAYRIGQLGYVTDCSEMPRATVEALRGVDTLIVNALRIKPHATHMNLGQALSVIKDIEPRQAVLIHMSHDIGLHADVSARLPENVYLAYDGMELETEN